MTERKLVLGCIGVLLMGVGCAESAKPPVLPTATDASSREVFYSEYRLTADIGAFSAEWKRSDGSYGWGQLDQLAQQFPESQDVYSRANTRGVVLGSMGAVGGGLVGYTLGYNLTASSDRRWSSGTQAAFYGVGGGLILVSAIIGIAWHNPAVDFADTYNNALRARLGLSARGKKTALTLAPWVPRPLGAGEVGWAF